MSDASDETATLCGRAVAQNQPDQRWPPAEEEMKFVPTLPEIQALTAAGESETL